MFREVRGDAGIDLIASDGAGHFEPRNHQHPRASDTEMNDTLFTRKELVWPIEPAQLVESIEPTEPAQPALGETPPGLVGTDALMRRMLDRTILRRIIAERAGMKMRRLDVFAGQAWGEQPDHLRAAAVERQRTGEVPKPQGDTMSYLISLALRASESGVPARFFVPKEVREHPSIVQLRTRLGRRVEWPDDHDLGGVLEDIGEAAQRIQHLQCLREDPAWTAHVTAFDQAIAECEAQIADRLAVEDAKIAHLVKQSNADSTVAAIIPMLPTHTVAGRKLICEALEDDLKDIDSLYPGRKTRRWGKITPTAMVAVAKYIMGGLLPRRAVRWQIGRGELVGAGTAELANIREDRLLDGHEAITAWVASPVGKVSLLLSAVPKGELIKADRIEPARPWWLLGARRVYIVDGGVATIVDAEGGTKTVGNLDLSTMPKRGKAVVATQKVGQITAAEAMARVVSSSIEREWPTRPSVVRLVWYGLKRRHLDSYTGAHRRPTTSK